MKEKHKEPFDPDKIQNKVDKLKMKAYFECSKGNNEEGLKCKLKADKSEELLKTFEKLNEGKFENNSWSFRIKYFLRNIQLYHKGVIKRPTKYL